jgi:3-phosphoshikimate 1-carboxyvinyltransferase
MTKARYIKTINLIDGVIDVPTSKSLTNRALIAAALASDVSKIINPSLADDCRLMIKALRKFGIIIEEHRNYLIVHGSGGKLTPPETEIYVGNAGTTMRFLTGLAAITGGTICLVGNERMNRRPLDELLTALDQMGVKYESERGYPPLTVHGRKLKGGAIKIDGTKSSQFVSSILLVAPYADSDVTLELADRGVSRPYIDLTLYVMHKFGVEVSESGNSFYISTARKYISNEYIIEADASSASYFFGAAAITGGSVLIRHISLRSKQGDIKFLDIIQQMGCKATTVNEGIKVTGGNLSAISVDMNEMPDMVPTLAVIALFAEGKTSIKNVKHLRYKESDRLTALATELRKLGAEVTEYDDGIDILPKEKYIGAEIETYDDHRIAMSFAIAGLKISGIKIQNPGCVKKSFPNFWDEFEKLFSPFVKGEGRRE